MAMIQTTKASLLSILDDASGVYFSPTPCANRAAVAALQDLIELPVIEDSISVDMGSVDVAYTKLTDGTTVAGKFSKGDPSCSFQVASIADAVNGIFASRVDSTNDSDSTKNPAINLDGDNTTASVALKAYSNGLLVKKGTLIIANKDTTHMVIFPNAAISGSFNPTGGGNANTGYWNVSFIPYSNAELQSSTVTADSATFYLG